jgi:hypothetical protein
MQMNFGLSMKYSEIDFEEVSLTDLMLIGGGCGESGGGSVTVASAQAAQQQAASQPGANLSAGVSYSSPNIGGNINFTFTVNPVTGPTLTGTGSIQGSTGHVEAHADANVNTGGFWSSVGSFFSWLFGSH